MSFVAAIYIQLIKNKLLKITIPALFRDSLLTTPTLLPNIILANLIGGI